MTNLLEFKQVGFSYEGPVIVRALEDLSFQIKEGEFVGLVGRNGSGKTTLLQLTMSLLKPKQGEILLMGESTEKQSPAGISQTIGYVFQHPERQMFLDTVLAEVTYGPRQQGASKEEALRRGEEALERVGISHLAGEYPKALSRGEVQRVAVAIALALSPKLLILDEPTSGQDGASTNDLRDLLRKINAQGTAILLVTHDMELLAESAIRTIVMAKGSKVFDGPTTELFADPNCLEWGLELPVWLDIARQLPTVPSFPANQPDELVHLILKSYQGGDSDETGSSH